VGFYQEQKRQFCGIPVKRSLEQGSQWVVNGDGSF